MSELRGILAAVLTPFRVGTEDVDFEALERQVDWAVRDSRCDGVVVAGVETQEYQVLTDAGRAELVERTIEFVDGRVPSIVGVTAPSLRRSLSLIDSAVDAGADVVLVLAALKPWGAVPTESEFVAQFETLSSQSPVPVFIYNNPRFGVDLPASTMVRLAELENVKYFKETSRDIRKIGRLLVDIDAAGLARYFTTMEALLFTLQMGGPGAMMPPPSTVLGRHLIDAFEEGDLQRAVALQRVFAHFPDRWMRLGLLPAMKGAMRAAGLDVGDSVAPWDALSAAEVDAIAAALHPELSVAETTGVTR